MAKNKIPVQPIEFPTSSEGLLWHLRFTELRAYTECLLGFAKYAQHQGLPGVPIRHMEAAQDLLDEVDKVKHG